MGDFFNGLELPGTGLAAIRLVLLNISLTWNKIKLTFAHQSQWKIVKHAVRTPSTLDLFGLNLAIRPGMQ